MNINDSLQKGADTFFGFLPNLLGFLVILVVGYIVAKVVALVVRKALEKLDVDQHLRNSDANKYVERVMPGASVARGVGRVCFWLVFVFFLFSAIGALKVPAVTTFMNQVLAYLPNILAAIAIFVVAALIAGAVAGGVAKVMGDTPTGKIVSTTVPALVMVIAMFMILEQLNIAEQIVEIAFAATMGALALGLALAFGLGGRPVAQRLLEDAYRNGRQQKEQVKRDFQHGRENAEGTVQEAQGSMQGSTAGSTQEYGGAHAPSTPSQPTGEHERTYGDGIYSDSSRGRR